jgi:hypothetical protein
MERFRFQHEGNAAAVFSTRTEKYDEICCKSLEWALYKPKFNIFAFISRAGKISEGLLLMRT